MMILQPQSLDTLMATLHVGIPLLSSITSGVVKIPLLERNLIAI